MTKFNKVCRIGVTEVYNGRFVDVFVNIKYRPKDGPQEIKPGVKPDKMCLSITGVEGPKKNGDAWGSCGQLTKPEIKTFAPGWDQESIDRLWKIWDAWHLNDMRPGCEHQRAEGWDKRPIDPDKPLDTYGKHYDGQEMDSWNMLAWIPHDKHPEGLLSKPCPKCGYAYGSQWLFEPVPVDVVDWLKALPETDKAPAWV